MATDTLQAEPVREHSPTTKGGRSEWIAAIAALEEIKAADAAFTPEWDDAWQRCEAECATIPHVTFPPETYTGGRCQTTASAWEVRQARSDVAALDAGKMHLDPLPGLREHYELKRELVKAADERQRQIQAVRDRYNMDALDEKSEQIGDSLAEATSRLMDIPAPDLAALRWKLDHITEEARADDGSLPCYCAGYVKQMLADIERLLPKAG